MNNSKVKVLQVTQNPEAVIASAGRMSTTKGTAFSIYEKSLERNQADNLKTINNVLESGHTSTLEHVTVSLAFNNVSMMVEQFMIEYRLAAFTVKSRRYVDFGSLGHLHPYFDQYDENGEELARLYEECMDYLYSEYNEFTKAVPVEDARFLLPHAFCSNFYCTVNLREFCKIVYDMVYGDTERNNVELSALGIFLLEWARKKLPYIYTYITGLYESYSDAEIKKRIVEKKLLNMAEKNRLAGMQEESIKTEEDRNKDSVEILESTKNPEETVCRALFFRLGISQWMDEKDESVQKEVIKSMISAPVFRRRELEQAVFRILFHEMSLPEITHITRHRMHSLLLPSYLSSCSYDRYIMPQSFKDAGLESRYRDAFIKTKECRDKMLALGFNKRDCSYLLLSGMTLPVQTTMNANELYTFFRLRSCRRAQWEIQNHASELLKKLRKEHPVMFSLYGPSCVVTGKCPEGNKSCGCPPNFD